MDAPHDRAALVRWIRANLADELDEDEGYDFFHLDYEPGESADDALVRLFYEEREAQQRSGDYDSDLDVLRTMAHG